MASNSSVNHVIVNSVVYSKVTTLCFLAYYLDIMSTEYNGEISLLRVRVYTLFHP